MYKIFEINNEVSRRVVEKKQERAREQANADPEPGSFQACKKAIRSQVAHPDAADFHLFSIRRFVDRGRTIVKGRIDLLNDFGAMIPYNFHCEYAGGKVLAVEVWSET